VFMDIYKVPCLIRVYQLFIKVCKVFMNTPGTIQTASPLQVSSSNTNEAISRTEKQLFKPYFNLCKMKLTCKDKMQQLTKPAITCGEPSSSSIINQIFAEPTVNRKIYKKQTNFILKRTHLMIGEKNMKYPILVFQLFAEIIRNYILPYTS